MRSQRNSTGMHVTRHAVRQAWRKGAPDSMGLIVESGPIEWATCGQIAIIGSPDANPRGRETHERGVLASVDPAVAKVMLRRLSGLSITQCV
jgi:hypothetical protein